MIHPKLWNLGLDLTLAHYYLGLDSKIKTCLGLCDLVTSLVIHFNLVNNSFPPIVYLKQTVYFLNCLPLPGYYKGQALRLSVFIEVLQYLNLVVPFCKCLD